MVKDREYFTSFMYFKIKPDSHRFIKWLRKLFRTLPICLQQCLFSEQLSRCGSVHFRIRFTMKKWRLPKKNKVLNLSESMYLGKCQINWELPCVQGKESQIWATGWGILWSIPQWTIFESYNLAKKLNLIKHYTQAFRSFYYESVAWVTRSLMQWCSTTARICSKNLDQTEKVLRLGKMWQKLEKNYRISGSAFSALDGTLLMCFSDSVVIFSTKKEVSARRKVAWKSCRICGDVTGTGRGCRTVGPFLILSSLAEIWRLEKYSVAGADWYGLDLFSNLLPNGGTMGMMLPTWESRWYPGSRTATLQVRFDDCKAAKNKDTAWKFTEFVMKDKDANAKIPSGNSFRFTCLHGRTKIYWECTPILSNPWGSC